MNDLFSQALYHRLLLPCYTHESYRKIQIKDKSNKPPDSCQKFLVDVAAVVAVTDPLWQLLLCIRSDLHKQEYGARRDVEK